MKKITTSILATTFLLGTSAFSQATSLDSMSVGYYIKGYKGSEDFKYYPRGLSTRVQFRNVVLEPLSLSLDYKYLNTGYRFGLRDYGDSITHIADSTLKYDLLTAGANTISTLATLSLEWERIEHTSNSSYFDQSGLIGMSLYSVISDRNATNATIAYRISSINAYAQDVVFIATWQIGVNSALSVLPQIQTSLDLEDFSSSISVKYQF
ncbi:hypothetical protein [Reinekea sp. G2M2-21]|uniref:hypothetical protein n=1 Tax=Reinekea sp. G2M2-21 TaxID=2788942 RepID=UPI0018AA926B|nr:hypothetical protein [Reinekea sp. G2M2-21]